MNDTPVKSNESVKQPKCIEMPFGFVCSHCKKEIARLTTREEVKSGFVEDTRIMIDYVEDTETFEGNWFEIIDDMKKGLKIACCDCPDSNEGVKIEDGMEILYKFIDQEYPQGLYLKSVVKLNKKEKKTTYRVLSYKVPK